MKVLFSHLLDFFNDKPLIEDVSEKLFQLGHENEFNSSTLDIDITPNRGDCLSVRGIARDLNVFYDYEDNKDRYLENIKKYDFDFKNNDVNSCPNISFLKIEVKNISNNYKSYLQSYFDGLKINKNNFFADISNYVAYELGQPTHCYDLDKMSERLVFEKKKDSGKFETLLGQKIKLKGNNFVFSCNDKVMSIAGVMGGMESACSDDTRRVLVECAYFEPKSIIGKSIKYNLQSDAAHKFERGVDPYHHEEVLRRFIEIVRDHCDIENIEIIENHYTDKKYKELKFDIKKIIKIIGHDFKKDQLENIFNSLNLRLINNIAIIPSYRNDLQTNNDLAEEIARVVGYDNIGRLHFTIPKQKSKLNNNEIGLKNYLIDIGFNEVINMPFTSHSVQDAIKIDNPLDSNRQYMRSSISDSLIENLIYNERRQKDSIKIFEISDIYSSNKNSPVNKRISILVSGRQDKNFRDFSKFMNRDYLKKVFSDIGIYLDDNEINSLDRTKFNSKVKTKAFYVEIEYEKILGCKFNDEKLRRLDFDNCVKYKMISEYPSIIRDLSFQITGNQEVQILKNKILNYKSPNLVETFIFDFYKNEAKGFIKLGFRFIFNSKKNTLTDDIVDTEIEDIVNSVCEQNDNIIIPGYKN